MKIVIEIPEVLLDRIKSTKCVPDMYGSDIVNAVLCVRDGVPYEERPHGEWKIDSEYGYIFHCVCSKCNTDVMKYISGSENWWLNSVPYFCPNCGSDNRPRKRGLREKMGLIDDAADENPNFEYLKVGDTIYTQDDDKQGWTGKEENK